MALEKGLERLDKAIAAQTRLSRRQVRRLIGQGLVQLNGQTVRALDAKVDYGRDEVAVEGRKLLLRRYSYLMLHKPKGVVCATEDAALPTVLDLVPDELRRSGLFPAGRLDKDTTGFVLLTNDGDFAHKILSPKSHVPKTYRALLDKPADAGMARAFAEGLLLPPERGERRGSAPERGPVRCAPALLTPLEGCAARVVLRQGVYHQVKRMFAACGATVLALHREAIGGLALDPALKAGECRELTADEAAALARTGEETG